eukprot:TRINITY_DN9158_c0_g1_i1.p1 TRINITY_DN9158_c0_g1~~TRINITY_DN9158_c0_g1_i1.p1  ORF type:complete len:1225 (-),score=403.02 TRINITY_DN9158_c0_g1_i1:193-3867(-)
MSATWSPSKCLEQLDSRDKDFRYMALSDLHTELQKTTFKVDSDSEKRITLKLLDMVATDGSGDVKGFAVKCIGPLAAKAQKAQVKTILEKLRDYLVDESKADDVRDIASIGLKGVIACIPDTQEQNVNEVIRTVPSKVVAAIGASGSGQDVIEHCLDVLEELLRRWGKQLASEKGLYTRAHAAVAPHLKSGRSSIRKKAINSIARLSFALPEDLFEELIKDILVNIASSKKAEHIRTFLSAIGAISRRVGYRLGRYLNDIIPVLLKFSNHPDFDEDDDMRETCFNALESIISKCPKETEAFLPEILVLVKQYMAYDPNYADDESFEEDDDFMDIDGSEEDFMDDDLDYSDDDDMSWKVRKAASRCLGSIFSSHPLKLQTTFEETGEFLVKKFLEREENVRVDVFATFVEVLNQAEKQTASAGNDVGVAIKAQIPALVKGVKKELSGKHEKTKIAVLVLLQKFVTVYEGILVDHVGDIIEGVQSVLSEKAASSPLKLEALEFTRVFLNTHSSSAFQTNVESLATIIYNVVGDKYSKICAAGLKICAEIAAVFATPGYDSTSTLGALYDTVFAKLTKLDLDQEVKEVAISSMGSIVSLLGDKLAADKLQAALEVFVERLSNEVTRFVAVKTFDSVATSPLNLDMSATVPAVLTSLASFLRQQNRQLKLATLSTLTNLVAKHGSSAKAVATFPTVLTEITAIISEADLHLAHLGLRLATAIVTINSGSVSAVVKDVIPKCLALLKSSFLQGVALESMLALYTALICSGSSAVDFNTFLSSLTSMTSEDLTKHSYHSIAQCIAVLVANSEGERETSVTNFVNEVKKSKNENSRLLSLYSIAEIGRQVDISANKDVKKVVLSCFESPSEDLKTAASVALGCLAVGKLRKFLPVILEEMKNNPQRQYLLLGSMREMIVRLSGTARGVKSLNKALDAHGLLDVLFQFTGTEEEGNRNVVAECLGKLASIDPPRVVVALKDRIGSESPETRACVTTAIKSTIHEEPQPIDAVLLEHFGAFVELIKDSEIIVRKAVLLTFNYAAHLKPHLVQPLLADFLPLLYAETKLKPELIKEFEVGPFKHKVDTGIELRQAAFETIYTLLETSLSSLDLNELISHVASPITDTYDLQMLAHLIIARLTKNAPQALVASIETLITPLRMALSDKPQGEAVQQQIERHDEMIRSTLRAIHSVSLIRGIDSSAPFNEFLTNTVMSGAIGEKYAAVAKEQNDRA